MPKTAAQMVDEAMQQVKTLSVQEAMDLHGREDTQFVDIRDVRELKREGAVPGALHAPRGMLEFWVDPTCVYHRDAFAADKHFVFFCAAGWRSALATKTVQEMGLDNVSHIDGGFTAWKEAGGPVESKD